MIDGRIDTQGSIDDLMALGVLDDLIHKSDEEAQRLQKVMAEEAAVDGKTEDDKLSPSASEGTSKSPAAKKPKKLVKDEHREVGGVKWKVYNSYLRAS
jgi:hypothetical protein